MMLLVQVPRPVNKMSLAYMLKIIMADKFFFRSSAEGIVRLRNDLLKSAKLWNIGRCLTFSLLSNEFCLPDERQSERHVCDAKNDVDDCFKGDMH